MEKLKYKTDCSIYLLIKHFKLNESQFYKNKYQKNVLPSYI